MDGDNVRNVLKKIEKELDGLYECGEISSNSYWTLIELLEEASDEA
jgi:hypothetical protein